jgi:hypothetical protein
VKKLAAIAAVVAVSFTCTIAAQKRIDGMRRDRPAGDELLYLPNERLLNSFTCGLSSVVADVLHPVHLPRVSRRFQIHVAQPHAQDDHAA